jgi:hypothetical protein
MDGYRFPLRGLRPDEAEALLILGVPAASPGALAAIGEVFGPAAGPALEAAEPARADGWRVVTLSFEHERAAVHRLAGFGDQVEVLDPPAIRIALVATAREILGRYQPGGASLGWPGAVRRWRWSVAPT